MPDVSPPSRVANAGLLRPPLIYAGALIAGFAVHLSWPLTMPLDVPGTVSGALLVVLASALLVMTLRCFREKQTPFPGNRPVTGLILDGPFRVSRNPAYVAFSGIGLGIALIANSIWMIAGVACAVGVMQWVVIPREERYLHAQFGERYSDYARRVRRWL